MNTLDSRFRGNDRCLSHFVIPAKAGIHVRYPYLLSCYRLTKLSGFSLPSPARHRELRQVGGSQRQRENHLSLRSLRLVNTGFSILPREMLFLFYFTGVSSKVTETCSGA